MSDETREEQLEQRSPETAEGEAGHGFWSFEFWNWVRGSKTGPKEGTKVRQCGRVIEVGKVCGEPGRDTEGSIHQRDDGRRIECVGNAAAFILGLGLRRRRNSLPCPARTV